MGTPGVYDIEIYEGDTFSFVFRARTTTLTGGPGNYVDLTGCTAKAQIRETYNASTILAEFDTEVPAQTGDDKGKIILGLTHTQTATLDLDAELVWDVQVTWPDAVVQTLLRGKVTVIPEVTR